MTHCQLVPDLSLTMTPGHRLLPLLLLTPSLIVPHSLGAGGQLAQETVEAGAEQDRKHVNINLDISEHSAAVVTAIREAGQTLEAIQRSLRPGSLLAVYLLGQVSLSVLGWLLHLSTWLAGAALTLAVDTLTTPGDRRGGRARDDISRVVFKAVDLYS